MNATQPATAKESMIRTDPASHLMLEKYQAHRILRYGEKMTMGQALGTALAELNRLTGFASIGSENLSTEGATHGNA
jgi:hypothetical protein